MPRPSCRRDQIAVFGKQRTESLIGNRNTLFSRISPDANQGMFSTTISHTSLPFPCSMAFAV
jgi:hypothetical protein